jgi:hypothetical protein
LIRITTARTGGVLAMGLELLHDVVDIEDDALDLDDRHAGAEQRGPALARRPTPPIAMTKRPATAR